MPYLCDICKESFAKSDHLENHMSSNNRHKDIEKMKKILSRCLKQPQWKQQPDDLEKDDSEEDDLEKDDSEEDDLEEVVFDISLDEEISD